MEATGRDALSVGEDSVKLPDLKQPTTQRGLVALFTLLAANAPIEYKQQIADVGIFIYSCLLIWSQEDKKT